MPRGERNRKLSDADRLEVVRRYTTPLPDGTWEGSNTIAASFGVSQGTIIYTLQRAGIAIRNAREAHAHGKRCGPIKHTEQLEQPPLCVCGCGKATHWKRSRHEWAKYVRGHYRKPASYKSQDWLLEQYITKRRAVPDIALECGVNVSTIIKFMKRFGLERRNARDSHKGTQAGARNPAWKGGTTPERQRMQKTDEWKAMLRAVYARDNYTCQRCKRGTTGGKSKRSSVAHHIKSFAEHPDLRMDPANLVTLCRGCHEWVHSLENKSREFIG